MSTHTTTAVARWSGDLAGIGTIESSSIRDDISVPKNLSGRGVGTNTEDLLMSAAATCFSITAGYALTMNKLPFDRLRVTSTGHLELERGLRLAKIVHEVDVLVHVAPTSEQQEAILRVVAGIEKSCLVSRAMAGNVDVVVNARVVAV
jgi:peroxiredoxin-like protein